MSKALLLLLLALLLFKTGVLCRLLLFWLRGRFMAQAKNLHRLLACILQVHSQAFQDPCRDAFTFAHQAEQQVLGPNVRMIQASSFILGQLDHALGTWGQADCTRHNVIPTTNNIFYSATNLVEFNAKITQDFGSNAFAFIYQAE